MTIKQLEKKAENLDKKISHICALLQTLRESLEKVENRIKEAHEMTLIPNQHYKDEWASEEAHQIKNRDNLMEIAKDYEKQLDDLCHKLEGIDHAIHSANFHE